MGAAQSNPSGEHIFERGDPAQFGYNLVNALQQSPESDATRQRATDLEIQHRVRDELQRLQAKEDTILKEAEERLSKEPVEDYKLDRTTVSQSISTLAGKLSSQSKIVDESEAVKRAESAMVRCLRLNDRRPLDCWKEVENFKQEISNLEKTFVSKVVGDI